eukprot:gnl/Chilomastix_caulleri/7083.p1 GENE.gnl/Chilomastix_caulleri/7083~~gnl/Chilomastix_caulleri/7083.p1  ORF type:complete len:81 (+),score=9.01 gnl/Chilomastix_caulleri/7083:41-283(+)
MVIPCVLTDNAFNIPLFCRKTPGNNIDRLLAMPGQALNNMMTTPISPIYFRVLIVIPNTMPQRDETALGSTNMMPKLSGL